jgi:prolipoprotein diacylglyceryl transferase
VISLLGSIGWPVIDRFHLFGDFAVSPHGITIAVGYLFGAWILSHEGPKRGVTVEHINTMVFWSLVGTIIGARLFYVIGHYAEFDSVTDMLALWEGGLTLMGGIAGAVLINIPLFRRYHYGFFQVMDGAVIGLAFGIAFGRIGDLIIGDHFGKPTSWLLAFQYRGGVPAGFSCDAAETICETTLKGGETLELTRQSATMTSAAGDVVGVGVHQTALYDMFFATVLFLILYGLSRSPRRLGVLTLTFGAFYGAARVIEDFLRVDKRILGLTGSQWTGLTVSVLCSAILISWAVRAGPRGRAPDDDEADAEMLAT